jgi:hypothetical protein
VVPKNLARLSLGEVRVGSPSCVELDDSLSMGCFSFKFPSLNLTPGSLAIISQASPDSSFQFGLSPGKVIKDYIVLGNPDRPHDNAPDVRPN